MPELRFIMNGEDELEFVRLIFAEAGRLIPGLHYRSPQYAELVTEQEYLVSRKEAGQYFIVSKRFQKTKLCMDYFEKSGERQYFIAQKEGGPEIRFSPTNASLTDGCKILRVGCLSHYASYWLRAYQPGDPTVKASPELKAYYQMLVKHIKQRAKIVKGRSGKHRFYLCEGAQQEVERGQAELDLW